MNKEIVLPTDGEVGATIAGFMTGEVLLQRAKTGEKLGVADRRACLNYMLIKERGLTNVEIAEIFGISETMVRKDRAIIESVKATEVFSEDANLIVYRTVEVMDSQISALEASKKKSKQGSRDFVLHCKVISDLAKDKIKLLQELGFVTKSVSTATQDFDFAAIVVKGDQIDTRSVSLFDDATQKKLKAAAKTVDIKAIPQPEKREIVYVETTSVDSVSDPKATP